MEEVNLDASALSSLTNQINAGLKPGIERKQSQKLSAGTDKKAKKNVEEGKSGDPKHAPKIKSSADKPKAIKHEGKRDAKPTVNSSGENAKGKKRSRDGKIKEGDTFSDQRSRKEQLKKEVLDLGGTEEDLDLIDELDSGSEIEGSGCNNDKALGKEINNLVKELGLSKAATIYEAEQTDENQDMEAEEDMSNPNEIAVGPKKTYLDGRSPNKHGLIFEPTSEWHSATLSPLPEPDLAKPIPDEIVGRLQEYAGELLQQEGETYGAQNKSSSSAHQFYSTIMSSGTLTDKISALTLSAQESPLHNQRALETLLSLAGKRSRGQAIEVLAALKDLLGPGSLLPSDRRLRAFASQPGLFSLSTKDIKNWKSSGSLPGSLTKAHLVSWAFEDKLKSMYFEILKILETWCNDEIVYSRTKAVDIVYELLRDKPEQEANLLRLLVNKLGDTEKKIASRASYNILQLQIPHPLMKPTIISAIEQDILFKPGQSLHAKYYAIITLNQTILSSKEDSTVRKILDIYFSLFVILLRPEPTKKELEEIKPDPEQTSFNKKGQRQGGGGKPGKMALKKQKVENAKGSPDEQLREKMMSAVLTGINRAIPYADVNDEFFEKHLDTLFKITHSSNFNTSVQALMLIQQLCGSHQAASDRFYRTLYESLLDPRLLTTSKQILYLNLLYRALRADLNVKRVKAFAKRLLQVIAMHQPSFACAVLYLLRELEGPFPALARYNDEPEQGAEDEEERYQDVPEDGVETDTRMNGTGEVSTRERYDGRKRAPEYSNADKSCLWELNTFIEHYHPSVALFAKRLMDHEQMPPKPTLDSHTLIKFLDRFVYRNPKKVTGKMHGASIMQPMAGGDASGLLVSASATGYKPPVNSDAFYKRSSDKVEAEDAFFHKYFSTKAQGKESAKQRKEKKKGAEDDSEAETDEDEIWQALVDSHPDIEGPSDDDDDMEGLSELEDGSDLEDADPDGGVELADFDDEDDEDSADEADKASDGPKFEDEEGALLGSDDELPSDFDEALTKDVKMASEDEDKPAERAKSKQKRERRKKLKSLPMFASAEDYAALLGGDDDML